MKFKSFVGKQVFGGGKIITFKHSEYETTDKAEIEALKGAKGVEEVKAKRAKTSEKED